MFGNSLLRSTVRRIVLSGCLAIAISPLAVAQQLPDFELFGGYTFLRPEGGQADLHGAYAGFAKPVNNWMDIVAEISGLSGSQTLTVAGSEVGATENTTNVNFVSIGAGPRFVRRGERISPFVQFLFGLAHGSWSQSSFRTPWVDSIGETSFGVAVGGGLDATLAEYDLKTSDRVLEFKFRMFQAEYVVTHFSESIENNFRISSGLVFEW